MSAVWLVGMMEQSQILILPALSMVLSMSAVWLVRIIVEQSQVHILPALSVAIRRSAVWLV